MKGEKELIEKIMDKAYNKCPEKYCLQYYQDMRKFTIRAIRITIREMEKIKHDLSMRNQKELI